MRSAIDVSGLRAAYGDRVVLDGVSFAVPWDAVTGFVGVNGAGKTTTLRRIVGLDQGTGTARVAGAPYRSLEDPTAALGFCPDALGAAPGQTARQHLHALALRAGLGRGDVDRALAKVGLLDVRRRIRTFSVGMRRRLAIAGALLAEPRILVLDEPFDGLDPGGRRGLAELLRAHADAGGAVLLSAHALDEIEPLLDRLVCLHAGRVRYDGETERFLRQHAAPVVVVRSLDQPALARALRATGLEVRQRRDAELAVRGASAEQIARIALHAQVLVTELTPRRTSLSAAFAAAIESRA